MGGSGMERYVERQGRGNGRPRWALAAPVSGWRSGIPKRAKTSPIPLPSRSVFPANAGIQGSTPVCVCASLDPRIRGEDEPRLLLPMLGSSKNVDIAARRKAEANRFNRFGIAKQGLETILSVAIVVTASIMLSLPVTAQSDANALQQTLDHANGLFVRGLYEDAVAKYNEYLDTLGSSAAPPEVWYRLGEAAYAAQEYERALEAFEQLQALSGGSPYKERARLSQGEVYYFMAAYDRAIALLTPLVKSGDDPESQGRALYFLGKAYLDSGKSAEAVERFKTVVDKLPTHALAPFAEFNLAYAYTAKGDRENAAIHFSAVANSDADPELRMESRFRAAQTYDQIGWYSAALRAYELLREEFPESPFQEQASTGYVWALYHEGKCAESAAAIAAHLKLYPNTTQRVELDYVRANCLQRDGDNEKAMAAFEALRAQHPNSEFANRALYKLAWIHYLANRLSEAQTMVTQFLQGEPPADLTGEAAFLLGTIFVAQGNFTEAQEEFRLVAEQYPDSEFGAEALFKAGECLEALAMADTAAATFEQFVTKYPEHPLAPQAILRAGDTRFAAGAFEAAVERYTNTLEKDLVPEVEEQVRYRLALTYHNMKNYEASAKAFSTLLKKFPHTGHREEALFRVAEYTLKVAENPLEAVDQYEALLEAAPEGTYAGRARLGLALARYEHKDYEQAAELFLQLMRNQPDAGLNEEAYTWTGQWYFDNQEWANAAETFEALLVAVPAYPYAEQVRLKIAECLEQSGDHTEALKRYEEIASSSSTTAVSTEARWHIAQIFEAQGDEDKALTWYQEAANSNAGEIAARAHFQIGVLQEKQEAWEKAAVNFMGVAILFLHEDLSPEALWRAGQCYEKSGQTNSARKAYGELRSDFPDSAFAKKAEEALQALGAS